MGDRKIMGNIWPLDFPECPNCGSTSRAAESVLEELKEKGRAGKDMKAFLFNHNSAIMDPSKVNLTVTTIASFYDVCVDCGTCYCIHADRAQVMPNAHMGGRN